jgi:hypothetical protein
MLKELGFEAFKRVSCKRSGCEQQKTAIARRRMDCFVRFISQMSDLDFSISNCQFYFLFAFNESP